MIAPQVFIPLSVSLCLCVSFSLTNWRVACASHTDSPAVQHRLTRERGVQYYWTHDPFLSQQEFGAVCSDWKPKGTERSKVRTDWTIVESARIGENASSHGFAGPAISQ